MSHFKLLLALLAGLLFNLFFAINAFAHRPVTNDAAGITTIPDPNTSYAFYESLYPGSDADIYSVFVEGAQFFHAGINIPQIDELEEYGVSLALLGPGLPALSDTVLPPFPQDHEENENIQDRFDTISWTDGLDLGSLTGIVVGNEKGEDFFEPFTLTRYWGRQVVELDLPEAGTYYLLVWQPDGISGKYVLDTGRVEKFSLGDFFRLPVWWIQIHIYFEHTVGLILGASIFLILLASVMVRHRLRLRRS